MALDKCDRCDTLINVIEYTAYLLRGTVAEQPINGTLDVP